MISFLRLGAALAALAVALGAFGAHGLADSVTPERLASWRTAATYHLVHAVALVALAGRAPAPALWLLTAGIALFSGALYLLVLLDRPVLGAVAPLGGLCFIAGWVWIAAAARGVP